MKYFCTTLALLIFIYFFTLLPQTSYAQTYYPNTCGNWTQSSDCELQRTDSGKEGSCNYLEKGYDCPFGATEPIFCSQRTPLNCGKGVTVCSNGNGYNCQNWCHDQWNNYLTSVNNQPSSNCNPAVTAFNNESCYQNWCLSNQCTNSGTGCSTNWSGSVQSCPTNTCPGQYIQCNPSHQCVYQPPPPPTCPSGQIINNLEYSCKNGSSCPDKYYLSGRTCSSGQVCCYTSKLTNPDPITCTLPEEVPCTQTIASYDENPLCLGTGTQCTKPGDECCQDGCCKPPKEFLCPAGEVIDSKYLYSCVAGNSGNSCPVGSRSASQKSCPSGKTCCYSLLVGPPPSKNDEGYCSVLSAISTGTNSGKATATRYGFNRIDWYLSKSGATPIFHHTTNVAPTNSSIDEVIGKDTTFSNLSANTKYTVTAKGWCQSPECTKFSRNCLGAVSFTTGPPKPEGGSGKGGIIPPPSLQCWGSYEVQFGNAGVARWVDGTGTGVKYTANFNLPGTSGYKPGEGCFRPGVSVSDPGPEDGTLGGRIYVVDSCTSIDSLVKNTAKLTQPADFGNILYWVWSTADNGGPMCMLNNGTYCQLQDNSLNYVSSSNRLLGTIFGNDASPLYSGNSVSLISWDSTRFKPLGYYRYQHSVGKNCFDGPNGVECTQHACEPINPQTDQTGQTIGREFYYFGGWLCDGCTGSPGYFSKPLVNNFYPNPDAPYCLSNDPSSANAIDNINPNGRIDFVFERTGNSFTVSGYVYQDTNKNGTQDGGETTGIPDVTINLSDNLSGTSSPQTVQTNNAGHYSFTNVPLGNYSLSALTPEGYKLTTPESKDIIVGCDGLPSQNFLARTSYYISGYVKNDINFDGECSQDEPSFAGTVALTNNIANRQPILLSGNGDYIFDDLPIPNPNSPNKAYTYKVTADIGITPTSGLPYQEILTLPPSKKDVNFCIQVSSPWVQTDGDVHSNTGINMPKGPKPKPTP